MDTTSDDIIRRDVYTHDELTLLLQRQHPEEIERIRRAAHDTLLQTCGPRVSLRGLLEFSNICVNDCFYCGIRAANPAPRRYCLSRSDILNAAQLCVRQGYGSLMLQSGQRNDSAFIDWLVSVVKEVKRTTRSETLPRGLGITLGIGEQSEETYARLREAGAHRYLVRIETTDPGLYRRIHPESQSFSERLEALYALRRTGFQVGTGVMIGLPGQTPAMLARDIAFFKDMDIDMIGMGPYIPHPRTPLADSGHEIPSVQQRCTLSLLMIALTRLVCKDVNIAATTALETIHPRGKQEGLRFGANVVMPQVSPEDTRREYLLYQGKPWQQHTQNAAWRQFLTDAARMGRRVAYNTWGDSPHFSARTA
jgi:biotin synthase